MRFLFNHKIKNMKRGNKKEIQEITAEGLTNTKKESEIGWWIKIGGGSFRMTDQDGHKKIIKPKQRFQARLEDIPVAFRDTIKPSGWEPKEKTTAPKDIPGKGPVLRKVQRKNSKVWFDVVNEEGKPINEKALREQAADELIEQLS